MYQPEPFREDRPEVLAALIAAHPLGLLISGGPSGLEANPLPFLWDDARRVLRAHLARANAQWRTLAAAPDCLVVFQGPQDYVTPAWYASKREHGKVVPTWNYVLVEARGQARVFEDPSWLERQIADLTRAQEAPRIEPWAVTDAPAPFVAAQIRGIVGIEIAVSALSGKWKLSQNRPEADRQGVIAGYSAAGAGAMSDLVAQAGRPAATRADSG